MAKTYNTVPDKSAGDTFTEAMWDDSLKTNLNNLIVPPACSLSDTTSVTNTTGGSANIYVEFATEDYDTDSMCSAGGSVITLNTGGIWHFNWSVKNVTNLDSNFRYWGLLVGATIKTTEFNANGVPGHGLTYTGYFAATSTIAIIASMAGNGTVDYDNAYLSATWLGLTTAP